MATSINQTSVNTQLRDLIDYSKPGVSRQILVNSGSDRFSVVCLTARTALPEHTTRRNVSIIVLEGRGILTLEGREIALEPGVFVYLPANAPHALQATENLAFLHT
ncbi:MAG: hypothetical protein N4J56_006742 [Chroococcidiopsis sp. SAG 2025]|uniref:cupin domain-containing protein n=1 Tax=Chroococcidiopsis sp. SAG 2025 TaxID=171389 RepID=UPI0029373D10|nr:cupin domain-containing protein [Chroococcidiopsis sp. SAG 2025]MDV2997037.1 hypothetical protein [Chroococcidiopsis sp. SAG 2025]